MKRQSETEEEVRAMLAPFGLVSFGWFDAEGCAALLIGNAGSSLWPAFSQASELTDGMPDPMNRWTVASVEPIAEHLGASTRYPFGETIWPFQQYAKAATGMGQSPLGLLIHSEFGLWTAFRAVLVFDQKLEAAPAPIMARPCDDCVEKPCLFSCPVGAFAEEGYDYPICKAHVASDAGRACRENGCLARQACPVGREYTYSTEHQAFHMVAFV